MWVFGYLALSLIAFHSSKLSARCIQKYWTSLYSRHLNSKEFYSIKSISFRICYSKSLENAVYCLIIKSKEKERLETIANCHNSWTARVIIVYSISRRANFSVKMSSLFSSFLLVLGFIFNHAKTFIV